MLEFDEEDSDPRETTKSDTIAVWMSAALFGAYFIVNLFI